jgi:hypothetical protein
MAEKRITEFLTTLLHEAREKGLLVRKRQNGGITISAGKRKIIIVMEEADE